LLSDGDSAAASNFELLQPGLADSSTVPFVLWLQTSVDGVYAIGDVASFPLLVAGGALVRQEHVTHARSSAAQAAKALLGECLPYQAAIA
jgi:NADPH-dependent 2,4-dienoyl-CoA reductase/sulfur reductase-like enzyme